MMRAASFSQSVEDLLEAVLVLGRAGRRVRVTDLAGHLGVTKPSVSAALNGLERRGLIRHERYGEVQLTTRGAIVAEATYRRHRLLHEFLRDVVGVPDRVAARDACRLEHAVSTETMERLAIIVQSRREGGSPVNHGHQAGGEE